MKKHSQQCNGAKAMVTRQRGGEIEEVRLNLDELDRPRLSCEGLGHGVQM